MQRLGYQRYVSQGGDWGAIISQVMAVQAPAGLLGIHTNMPGTVPQSVLRLIRNRDPAPSSFSDAEKAAFASLEYFYRKGFGYAEMMNTRPQTLGYGSRIRRSACLPSSTTSSPSGRTAAASPSGR